MRIERHHSLGREAAKARLESVAQQLADQFALNYDWRGDTLDFHGSGIRGKVDVADDAVLFDVRLGLPLMMMESPIRNAIENALDKELG